MRRDAKQNRDRIVAAAETVFGSHGAAGSTEEVARLANVGIATVFRHFPTKEALVEAALAAHFNRLATRAESLRQDPDAGSALSELVRTMVRDGATKVTLASMTTKRGELQPSVRDASNQLRDAVAAAVRRAQDSGAVRGSVTVDEVYLLIRALAQTSATAVPERATLDRAVDIVLSGLRVR